MDAPALRNIFACLVHENPMVVLDLVRNLHALDPASLILLYNGGRDSRLFDRLPLAQYDAVIYPGSQPATMGRLHDFALACMRFASAHYSFDTLTIVDSDQLAIQPGYSAYLRQCGVVAPEVGLLSNQPARQSAGTLVYPAQTAHAEFFLWQPFLRRFPRGEEKFVHWSFWPSTVFLADAARELVRFYDGDEQIQTIVRQSRIWATEEVILPTLVALLGYRIEANPCSDAYVRYRVSYSANEVRTALNRSDAYWLHPVVRQEYDPIRRAVRDHFHDYRFAQQVRQQTHQQITPGQINGQEIPADKLQHGQRDGQTAPGQTASESQQARPLLLTLPILRQMQQIEGWLEEDEADLLIAATAEALRTAPAPHVVLEVGSYLGRSTLVLGRVVQTVAPTVRVYAVDPHEGKVGAADQYIQTTAPTLARFQRNMAQAGLAEVVVPIQKFSYEVVWEQPIALLLIDGLHDYENVARDFHHFARWVVAGGYIVFHDYADYYPGVKRFVNELLTQKTYRTVACARTLMVIQKLAESEAGDQTRPVVVQAPVAQPTLHDSQDRKQTQEPALAMTSPEMPLVSCIMPTYNRRPFVAQAIRYYRLQDYPNRELIILDDGTDPIQDLVPDDPSIRYERLSIRQHMGAKHNLACARARGEIIVHWDDDDWVANWRISYQVKSLLAHREAQLCGLAALLFYDPMRRQAWHYRYPLDPRPWVCGNSLCYWRSLWESYRHPEINEGADTLYVWGLPHSSVLPLADPHFLVGLIHAGNTSPKQPQAPLWQPYPEAEIERLMGEDWKFYQGLFSSTYAAHDGNGPAWRLGQRQGQSERMGT